MPLIEEVGARLGILLVMRIMKRVMMMKIMVIVTMVVMMTGQCLTPPVAEPMAGS